MDKKIKKVFEEIEELIRTTISKKPVPTGKNYFIRRIKQLKKEYETGERK